VKWLQVFVQRTIIPKKLVLQAANVYSYSAKVEQMKLLCSIVITALNFFIMEAQALPQVDVSRYEGPWYVIGYKPTFMDKNWRNTVETYKWDAGKKRYDVVTTYKKSPDGKTKELKQKLLPVENSGNAKWIARIWLVMRADYIIYRIADDYSWVVVGHPEQKYLYIMSRAPQMPEELYSELADFAVSLGYKREDIVKQPQD
jgi:apolipoprotein D and lipocalin family protein